MNKKLLAFAVAAAFAAPMVANADSGNVTIYGQANMSVDNVNTGATGADKYWGVASNSSRLGFKGSEALGNGLTAVFQMETAIAMDANAATTAFMNRNTFVGLSSGSMGTVVLGKHDTPYKLGTASLDVFADTLGDYNAIVGNVGNALNGALGTSNGVAFDSRLGNVAAYISPTWSGFHFAAATVTANEGGNGATSNPSAYSATGVYSNGPIFASLSYEKATGTAAAGTNVPNVGVLGANGSANATKLGLGYDYGMGNINFIWENVNVSSELKGTGADRTAYYLAGTYKMGNNTLKAAFGKANDGDSAADTSAKQYTLGFDHAMSKRTSVYALYTKMNNNTGATYGLGGNGAGTTVATATAGDDPSAISLGMKHSF